MPNVSINEKYWAFIEKEQIALADFFPNYLPADFRPKTILNFCAGLVNEEPVLEKIYGPDISMISFDASEHMLRMVEDLGLVRRTLIKLNTAQAVNYFNGTHFDLITGRNIPLNPNARSWLCIQESYPDPWPSFISDLKALLSPQGYLLLTLAREDEFDRARELLQMHRYRLLVAEENKISVPSDYIGIVGADVKDNYVILSQFSQQS